MPFDRQIARLDALTAARESDFRRANAAEAKVRLHEAAAAAAHRDSSELEQLRKKVKKLEWELRKKEKALAEAAALLVLRKKAQALWGDEDDDTPQS